MAAPQNPIDITPRQVANKSDKKALLDAIRMTLGVQSAAIRHNTQTFNRNRYTAIARIADYDGMKDRARQIKPGIGHVAVLHGACQRQQRR